MKKGSFFVADGGSPFFSSPLNREEEGVIKTELTENEKKLLASLQRVSDRWLREKKGDLYQD